MQRACTGMLLAAPPPPTAPPLAHCSCPPSSAVIKLSSPAGNSFGTFGYGYKSGKVSYVVNSAG